MKRDPLKPSDLTLKYSASCPQSVFLFSILIAEQKQFCPNTADIN